MINKSVCVVTPTIGNDGLRHCINSVINQTYPKVTHFLVVDGLEYDYKVKMQLDSITDRSKIIKQTLMLNTGRNGFYGHRIYAAVPHLLDYDYILFLDEDNTFDSNHVESMVNLLEKVEQPFVYSFRSIFNKLGTFVCLDNCESLGYWYTWPSLAQNKPVRLIDTSCWGFKRDWLQRNCHHWHSGWGGDRKFLYNAAINHITPDNCTREYTVNYRLGGNPGSVTEDFFRQGNDFMLNYYKGNLPWNTTA